MNDVVIIYAKFITVNGKKIYAYERGLQAFCLKIPRDKYKPR